MKLALLLLSLLTSQFLFSQTINNEKLDNYLNYIENNNLGIGSVSIFKAGKEVYNRNFGQKNLPDLTSYDKNKYQIGSVTKMATAILAFKLIEEGKLNLTDKLSDFYPQIPNSKKITIKNMLEHTSGLGTYVVKDGDIWVTEKVTEKQIFDLIIQQGVGFEPNEKVAYSNTAYFLLAKILEQKYKMPYHIIINNVIAKPLKLTSFSSVKSEPKDILKPYQYTNNKWEHIKDIDPLNIIGVGDIVSTPQDLNIFITDLFYGKIIKKESLNMMIPVLGKETWGRGMVEWDFDSIKFYGHGGDTIGSHAVLIYNKDADISISYNTNGQRIPKEEFIKNIVYTIYNKPFKLPEIK